jgi:hypothetical protein
MEKNVDVNVDVPKCRSNTKLVPFFEVEVKGRRATELSGKVKRSGTRFESKARSLPYVSRHVPGKEILD